ncbi:MAG TPA: hypothetical protein VGS22_14470 [Thermoanaerobaculia bacterium]|jgi:hypothetical protein|nr:hypothetical protein [Thermoanaerobaculia bacterium]
MASPTELTVVLGVALGVGIPVVFVATWSFVCAIIAQVSGYRSLAEFRIDRAAAEEGEALPSPDYATLGPARYRGRILKLRAGPGGLTLRILRIFLFHPPIRVPWERIREGGALRRFSVSLLLDERVRLGVPDETFAAIRDAKARYAG